jgi:ubiquinone biosynthesis protein UbiJ
MILNEAIVATFEQLLNQALSMDAEALACLAHLHGRVIKLELIGLDYALFFIPDLHGIQVYPEIEGEADCIIRGTPLELAKMRSNRESADQLFSGAVEIVGDSVIAQKFGETLSRLDIDWEEQLSRLTGDVIAHEAGKAVRGVFKWAANVRTTAGLNLREYLQEELRLLPCRAEIEPFLQEVDRLRDDVERSAARIERLRQLINPSEPGQ